MEAFDGKEGRAADSAAEQVPGGHTTALKSIRRPKPDLRGPKREQCLFDQPHLPVDLFGARMQRRRQPIINHLARP
jgi:hypothetical protein